MNIINNIYGNGFSKKTVTFCYFRYQSRFPVPIGNGLGNGFIAMVTILKWRLVSNINEITSSNGSYGFLTHPTPYSFITCTFGFKADSESTR
jgi:hypothetical protein